VETPNPPIAIISDKEFGILVFN